MGHSLGLGTSIIKGLENSSRFTPSSLSPLVWIETGISSGGVIDVNTGIANTGYTITTKAEFTDMNFTNGSKTIERTAGVDAFFNDVYAFGLNTGGDSTYFGKISDAGTEGCNVANEWDRESITDNTGILRCLKVTNMKDLSGNALDFSQATLNAKPYIASTGLKFNGSNLLQRTNVSTRVGNDASILIIANFLSDTTGVALAGDNGGTTTAFGTTAGSIILARIGSSNNSSGVSASTDTLYQLIVTDGGGDEQKFYVNSNSVTATTEGTSAQWNIGEIGGMNGGTRLTGLFNVMLLFDGQLSQTDINNLFNYYNNKY
jgi:hypothetical protein